MFSISFDEVESRRCLIHAAKLPVQLKHFSNKKERIFCVMLSKNFYLLADGGRSEKRNFLPSFLLAPSPCLVFYISSLPCTSFIHSRTRVWLGVAGENSLKVLVFTEKLFTSKTFLRLAHFPPHFDRAKGKRGREI
jgi:hypothetical protein